MPQYSARLDLPLHAHAPSAARAAVGAALPLWGLGHMVGEVEVLVSELVTNVVLHARGSETMRLEFGTRPQCLHLALIDGSALQPVIQELSSDGTTGRGLQLVSALASRWGTAPYGTGKRVWVEIDLSAD